jgi:hypothetical protein
MKWIAILLIIYVVCWITINSDDTIKKKIDSHTICLFLFIIWCCYNFEILVDIVSAFDLIPKLLILSFIEVSLILIKKSPFKDDWLTEIIIYSLLIWVVFKLLGAW